MHGQVVSSPGDGAVNRSFVNLRRSRFRIAEKGGDDRLVAAEIAAVALARPRGVERRLDDLLVHRHDERFPVTMIVIVVAEASD